MNTKWDDNKSKGSKASGIYDMLNSKTKCDAFAQNFIKKIKNKNINFLIYMHIMNRNSKNVWGKIQMNIYMSICLQLNVTQN